VCTGLPRLLSYADYGSLGVVPACTERAASVSLVACLCTTEVQDTTCTTCAATQHGALLR
jgi:hypothetical protein